MNTYVTEVQVWATVRVRAHSIDEARDKMSGLPPMLEVIVGGFIDDEVELSPVATMNTEIYGADIWEE